MEPLVIEYAILIFEEIKCATVIRFSFRGGGGGGGGGDGGGQLP